MVNYQNGKIYKIVGNGNTYYGSTSEPTLAKRLAKHRNNYKAYLKGNGGCTTSFKCFENDNMDFDISLVELFPCDTKDQLHARERYYIENNECVNKYIPSRKRQEYMTLYIEKNREILNTKRKEHYEQNKDKAKEYYVQNNEKIKENRVKNKEKSKQYFEENKEKIVKQSKERYEKNKERISKQNKERYEQNKEAICIKRKEYYEFTKSNNFN